MQNAVLGSWWRYDQRQYGCPWVCVMRADGSYNFEPHVGTYTGNARQGEGGDLVVFEPVVGQVYGYGQENYRGGRSMVCFAKWNGSGFVCCDKLGRELKWDGSGFVRCDKLGRGLKA